MCSDLLITFTSQTLIDSKLYGVNMVRLGNALLVERLVTVGLYKVFRLVFTVFQRLVWELNGTATKLREARDPKNYDRCCQVVNVVTVHRFCILPNSTIDEFIFTHNRFESPQYIIDNDHITLMTINDDSAVFCEPENKGMHLWRSKFSSFIRLAQYEYAKRLIVVPLHAFHRMAETIGDPKAEVILLFNTGRCGSTLLTQVMEYTGRCVSLSEPNSPTLIAQMFRKRGNTEEVRQIARDVIRWECRPYPTLDPAPLAYILKITGPSVVAVSLFRELFPTAKCLFMYRDTLAVAKSMYRLSLPLPSFRLAYNLGRLSPYLTEAIIDSMGFSGKDFHLRLEDDLTMGALVACVTMKSYVDMRRHGDVVNAIRYEELVGKQLETCRRLMEFCGLPESLAVEAVKGLELDSQRNSVVSKSVIGGDKHKEPELTPRSKESLNRLLTKFGLPLIGEDTILEGTLMINA